MLAVSAFNGALMDSTFNVFFKLKYDKLYDQMLATPLTTADIARGEITWGQLRGASYSAAFLLVMWAMGLVSSWWAVLALPAALLIGFAFSAVVHGADDLDDELAGLRQDHPRAAADVPVLGDVLPARRSSRRWLQWVVEATPLYRGVVLCRELTTGSITWASGGLGRLPRGDGPGRPGRRTPAARHAAPHLSRHGLACAVSRGLTA